MQPGPSRERMGVAVRVLQEDGAYRALRSLPWGWSMHPLFEDGTSIFEDFLSMGIQLDPLGGNHDLIPCLVENRRAVIGIVGRHLALSPGPLALRNAVVVDGPSPVVDEHGGGPPVRELCP